MTDDRVEKFFNDLRIVECSCGEKELSQYTLGKIEEVKRLFAELKAENISFSTQLSN